MMSCEKYEQLISIFIDGEISPEKKSELDVHLQNCTDCSEKLEQFKNIGNMMKSANIPEWTKKSQDSIMRAVSKELPKESNIYSIEKMVKRLVAVAALVAVVLFAGLVNNSTKKDTVEPQKRYSLATELVASNSSLPLSVALEMWDLSKSEDVDVKD